MKLSDRQIDVLVSALSLVPDDEHNLAWLNRVLKGTKSLKAATRDEVTDLWRILNHSESVEVTEHIK